MPPRLLAAGVLAALAAGGLLAGPASRQRQTASGLRAVRSRGRRRRRDGRRGSTVSAETADAVIVVDRLDRLAEAMRLSRRTLRIAKQSVLAGMGLSIVAMGVPAAGYLRPLAGALLQDVIDVAVIVNALRVLRG
jgi:hypothetical protein